MIDEEQGGGEGRVGSQKSVALENEENLSHTNEKWSLTLSIPLLRTSLIHREMQYSGSTSAKKKHVTSNCTFSVLSDDDRHSDNTNDTE